MARDTFIYGRLETIGDHFWHWVDLERGKHVIRLEGSGVASAGGMTLVLCDSSGVEGLRSDGHLPAFEWPRVAVDVHCLTTLYLDVSAVRGSGDPDWERDQKAKTAYGRDVGGYALIVNRVSASPIEAMDWGTKWSDPLIDVYFGGDGETARDGFGPLVVERPKGWSAYEARRAVAALDALAAVCGLTVERTSERTEAELTPLLDPRSRAGAFFNPPERPARASACSRGVRGRCRKTSGRTVREARSIKAAGEASSCSTSASTGWGSPLPTTRAAPPWS